MRTTIDAAGRLVIPKEIRTKAGLEPGMPLEVRLCDGIIEIEPVAVAMRLERRGHALVVVPEEPMEPLTHEDVEAIREALLDERGSVM